MTHYLGRFRAANINASLCWTARITSLAAGIGLFFLILRVSFDIPALVFLLVPVLIAWRAHLIGGILLALIALIAANQIIYIRSASQPYGWERMEAILIVLPVAVVYLISGVLHITVWWRETSEARHKPHRVPSGLVWTAGLIPLVIALFLLGMAGSKMIRDFDPAALVLLTPLIVAVIALRWHLLGGIAIVALSEAMIGWAWVEAGLAMLYGVLFFTPFAFSGMLHIVVGGLKWHSKRLEKQV